MSAKKSVQKKQKTAQRTSQRGKNPSAHKFSEADKSLRQHVLYMLKEGGAHLTFEQAIADLPADLRARKPPNAAHTVW